MAAVQARRQRGGIVRDDQIPGAQVFDPFGARRVAHGAGGVDDQEPRVARTL
jgi:hypothetical protein